MEFIMKTDIEKSVPQVIEFNFEELKTELIKKTDHYNKLVVTEDGIKEAKSDKANLNNLVKMLNDNRISKEKEYMQPFNVFKAQVKELIELINKPVLAIDTQIKAFDDIKREEKFKEITRFYSMNIGDLLEVLPLETILNPKWANATVSLITITQEMITAIEKARNDLKIIEAMKLDCEIQMKDAYLRNLDMSAALAEKHRFEEQQAKLNAIKKAEKEKTVEPIAQVDILNVKEKSHEPIVQQPVKDKLFALTFKATGSKESLIALGEYAAKNNIKLEKVVS